MPQVPAPNDDVMVAMVKELRVELGMALFGVDVIMNMDTHILTIIDINIFPGEGRIHNTRIFCGTECNSSPGGQKDIS